MNNQEKIQFVDRIFEELKAMQVSQQIPIQVGTLKSVQGINGFERANVGHPVFEFKDRYIIYLKSETELLETVYNPKTQGWEKKIGFFATAIPYYKQTLTPEIDFLNLK